MQPRVTLVSAGMLAPKKADHIFGRRHRYLNFGLLTLGTLLSRSGYSVDMTHGNFSAPSSVARTVADKARNDTYPLLLLSLPSVFAIPWAKQFLNTLKAQCPNIPVVVGGRWVIGDDPNWVRQHLTGVDLVVGGTAEHLIEQIVAAYKTGSRATTAGCLRPGPEFRFIELDYSLDADFPDFQPSIEVSRGCGMGCQFCEERSAPLTKIRDPKDIISAVAAAYRLYNSDDLNFYFEASFFLPTTMWAATLGELSKHSGLRFLWRCETRVDAIHGSTVEELARSGLRVFDLGLESASPKQLLAMRKTRNPDRYLKKASELLEQCRANGIWPKVNVMLYAGETPDTLRETTDWLEAHRNCVKGVSVAPLTVYGHGDAVGSHIEQLKSLGASPVDAGSAASHGFTPMHLSPEIDYEASLALSTRISQMFMTERDYYDLKKFSYFPRRYSYAQFLLDLKQSTDETLPFRRSAVTAEIQPAEQQTTGVADLQDEAPVAQPV